MLHKLYIQATKCSSFTEGVLPNNACIWHECILLSKAQTKFKNIKLKTYKYLINLVLR